MIPSIEFKHGKTYEMSLLKLMNREPFAMLDSRAMLKAFNAVKARKKELNEIMKAITEILDLKWKRKSIRIYCLSFKEKWGTFSDPLTVPLCDRDGKPMKLNDVIDLITHELIHNALKEMPYAEKANKKISQDFSANPPLTATHGLVHAIHYMIYKKQGKLDRIEKNKKHDKGNPPYEKAWQIVEEQGAENLLKKYLGIKVKEN